MLNVGNTISGPAGYSTLVTGDIDHMVARSMGVLQAVAAKAEPIKAVVGIHGLYGRTLYSATS